MPRLSLIAALLAGCVISSAQVPASRALSDKDRSLLQAEVGRIEKLLGSAPDTATVTYEMARVWATAGQWSETMQCLRKVDGAPSRNSLTHPGIPFLPPLRGTREFEERSLSMVQEATPPVLRSRRGFVIRRGAIWLPRVWLTILGPETSISEA